ncbi:DUF1837 domain-containing protein [Pantoea ananatis]|uniref:Hachiman antiphage defense system protein HamA n=1 Tax=Pantoea ananas TaxID=553 RepID=UPI00158E13DE|nr:Hachiman antiphage defense system protein HamA [Pantoea ananatis]MBA4823404.1 DUF1837 domain-containing protein [Pantoea ananatis]QKV88082.1 DUF1837 domain-containing protein [Pantoea ananatis]
MLPNHLEGLNLRSSGLKTVEGHTINVWEFTPPTDPMFLDSWALHFRRQYCSDKELPELLNGTGMTVEQYLKAYIFPDKTRPPGPSIRSGDFAEFLISDYLEFMLNLWVPREKYAEKASNNESVKGVDIMGFHQLDAATAVPGDALYAFEVKASLSGATYGGQLQNAVNDGSSDQHIRLAVTLNATKRRFIREGKTLEVNRISRFQNPTDNPYKYFSGAVAVLCNTAFNEEELAKTLANAHSNAEALYLMVVRSDLQMQLVHELYERACK